MKKTPCGTYIESPILITLSLSSTVTSQPLASLGLHSLCPPPPKKAAPIPCLKLAPPVTSNPGLDPPLLALSRPGYRLLKQMIHVVKSINLNDIINDRVSR